MKSGHTQRTLAATLFVRPTAALFWYDGPPLSQGGGCDTYELRTTNYELRTNVTSSPRSNSRLDQTLN
jgi:hypothetical protein